MYIRASKSNCRKHPMYKGKQKPRTEQCSTCWTLYEQTQAMNPSEGFQRNRGFLTTWDYTR